MGDMSGVNCSINNHNLYQHDCDYNNGDVSSGYGLLNSHTLYQCEDSIFFKEMYGVVKKVDVSSGYGSMNSHTDLQQNCLESLMNDNDRIDTNMNETLQNGDVISGNVLINIHNHP